MRARRLPPTWPLHAAGFTTAFGAHGIAANLGHAGGSAVRSLLALGLLLALYDGAEVLGGVVVALAGLRALFAVMAVLGVLVALAAALAVPYVAPLPRRRRTLALTAAVVQPRTGRALDAGRVGVGTALRAGLALTGVGLIAAALPAVAGLLLAASLVGVGTGVVTPVGFAARRPLRCTRRGS